MSIELSERPLTEIRIPKERQSETELAEWIFSLYDSVNEEKTEYLFILPHPKHKALGGLDIDKFIDGCPKDLASIILGVYCERVKDREAGSSSNVTGFDLDNDFGFMLIAFV